MKLTKKIKEKAQKYGFSDMFFTPSNEDQLNERIETFTKSGDPGTFTIVGIVLNFFAVRMTVKDDLIESQKRLIKEQKSEIADLKKTLQDVIQDQVEDAEIKAGWDPTP